MLKRIGKRVVLFLLVVIAFFGSFGWEILVFKKPNLNYATVFGIFVAICYSINSRWLKWKDEPEYQSTKFIWPFVFSLFICIPIVIFVILPIIGQPQNIWVTDSIIAYLAARCSLSDWSTTAIGKNWERVQKVIKYNTVAGKKG